jgi:ribosomal protein L16 Arg81 hydroxylase
MRRQNLTFLALLVCADTLSAFQATQRQLNRWEHSEQTHIHASTLASDSETREDSVAEGNTRSGGINHSRAFVSILGDSMTPSEFFRDVWQQKPALFPATDKIHNNVGDGTWNDDKMRESPHKELTQQAWHIVVDLLERGNKQDAPELALVMKNRQVQNRQECFEKYGSTLFAPYLDGCSIVQNHADLISPWIAWFCQDLQQSFPHVYANTYLTPPDSQAMNPHADDREVFVVQLYGSKQWQVFEQVPIEYPYPHEQVGKHGLPVPTHVLEGDNAISTTLEAGDVLYIPRGYVHQAKCTDSPSFHVTIAIATFDWTIAGMMNIATNSILTRIKEYRKAILPCGDSDSLQAQIDDAIKLLKQQVTADVIMKNLNARVDNHVQRATPIRMQQIERARTVEKSDSPVQDGSVVGPEVAQQVTLTSRIRAATNEEKAQSLSNTQSLIIREEIEKDAMDILSRIQSDPTFECVVSDLRSHVPAFESNPTSCDFSVLALAKRAVELGEWAVAS